MHLRRRSSVKSAPSSACTDKLSNANRGLGSRLKRLHPAARIICARLAHKFHTCRAFCVLSDAAAFRKSAGGTFLAQAEAAMPRGGTTWCASPCAAKLYEVFDSLSRGATAPLLFHFPRTAKNGRSERKFQKTVAVLRKIWYTDKLDRDLARRDGARCGLTAFTATPDSRSG